MFNQHTLVKVGALGAPQPSILFSAQQSERMVKDEVRLQPVRDQYADLAKASERLTAGLSVFVFEQKQTEPA